MKIFENFTPQFSEYKTKSIFVKTANFTIEIAEAYLLQTRTTVKKGATGTADTEPCRGAMAADRCVSEKEMVNLAAQTAEKLRHPGAVLR